MADDTDSGTPDFRLPDPAIVSRTMADVAERGQRIVNDFLRRQAEQPNTAADATVDPFNIGSAFMEMTTRLMRDPARLVQAQLGFWQDYMTLWQNTTRRIMGDVTPPVIAEDAKDKRFKDDAWRESEVFDFIRQSYLLSARFFRTVAEDKEGLDPRTSQKVDFYTRQFVDAMSPTNFLLTNPEVLRRTVETGGENLLKGLSNLLADLDRGRGKLRIRMTDDTKFALGENIAITPGQVVFQNDLMQLIQYTPTTETVLKRPLLILPPWINKFYILDLRPKNSFIRWAVSQGHTVFVCSWVNPDERHRHKNWEAYINEGIIFGLDTVEESTGERDVNVIGYCVGGTLLAAGLALMARNGEDRIKSATLFTTQVDFTEAGELKVFFDEEQIKSLETSMNISGYLNGTKMANAFNMLRSGDLIWPYIVNNYMRGKTPAPFDLLYWNSDTTRMTAANHSFYLRKCYLENALTEGKMMLSGAPVHLSDVKIPIYSLAAREDHIAPARSAFLGCQFFGGDVTYVMSGSGHIAGVINPPDKHKYQYWTGGKPLGSFDDWVAKATEHPGSWWPNWQEWILGLDNHLVPAREPGGNKLKPLGDAPGEYVRVRV